VSKKRSVTDWQQEIRNGLKFREYYGGDKDWHRYKDYYRHKFNSPLPVNMMFSILRSISAQTYFRNPSITVTPRKPGIKYQLHARIVEKICRWLIKQTQVKQQLKQMISDSFLCGTAIGVHGYDSEYGFSSNDGPATLTQFDKKGYKIEYNSFINPGMPWFLRVRPDDVVFPWGTVDKSSAPWFAFRKLRPLDDLRKDPKYKVPKDMKGTFVQQRSDSEGAVEATPETSLFRDMQQGQQWVELWIIHDACTGRTYTITLDDANKTFLRDEEDPMQIDGLPCETLIPNPDPDYIWGVPDARIIEPQLLEVNEIRTQSMYHRRVDMLKMLYKKGSIDADELKKLLSEKVELAVGIEAEGSIRDAVMPMSPSVTGILQDMGFQAEQARQDIRETVGFSRVQMGEFQGKSHVTKSEVDKVMAKSDIRIEERRDQMADMVVSIASNYMQMIYKNWTTPVVQDIIGPDGAMWWLQFTGPEIAGEYNFDVNPSTAAPQDIDSRKRDAIEMSKAWTEMNSGRIQQGQPVPAELQRYFFQNYDGIDVQQLVSESGVQMPQSTDQPLPVGVAAGVIQRQGGAG